MVSLISKWYVQYKSSSHEWIESRKVIRLLRHCSDKIQGLMNLLDNLIRLAINGNFKQHQADRKANVTTQR
jgi:hypothetical protein